MMTGMILDRVVCFYLKCEYFNERKEQFLLNNNFIFPNLAFIAHFSYLDGYFVAKRTFELED